MFCRANHTHNKHNLFFPFAALFSPLLIEQNRYERKEEKEYMRPLLYYALAIFDE
jgi:hypothetical protein